MEPMWFASFLLIIPQCVLSLTIMPNPELACDFVVEEGSTLSLGHEVATPNCGLEPLLRWTYRYGGTETLLSFCDETMTCTGNTNNHLITVSQVNGDNFISNLTMRSVSAINDRSQMWVKSVWCNNRQPLDRSVCVYVLPVNLKCKAEEIKEQNTFSKFNLTCTMDRVVPEPECYFQRLLSNGSYIDLTDSRECTQMIDVNTLSEGENTIVARVQPYILPEKDANTRITKITPSLPKLSLPKSRILYPNHEFKQGYVRGHTINASCVLDTYGVPMGEAGWYKSGQFKGKGTYTLDYTEHWQNIEDGTPVNCLATSPLGRETTEHELSPKFAFLNKGGISLFNVDQQEKTAEIEMKIDCSISDLEINPAPKFGISIDGSPPSLLEVGQKVGEMYTASLVFRPDVGGEFRLACWVENYIFGDMIDTSKPINITLYSQVKLAYGDVNNIVFYTTIGPDSSYTVKVPILAFPVPHTFTLYRDPRQKNETLLKVDQSSNATSSNTDEIEMIFAQESAHSGIVYVTFKGIEENDLGSYTLTASNDIGEEFSHIFSLKKENSSDLNLVALILGIGAGVGFISILVVVIIIYRRRQNTDGHVDKNSSETGDDDNYTTIKDQEDENVYTTCDEEASTETGTLNIPKDRTTIGSRSTRVTHLPKPSTSNPLPKPKIKSSSHVESGESNLSSNSAGSIENSISTDPPKPHKIKTKPKTKPNATTKQKTESKNTSKDVSAPNKGKINVANNVDERKHPSVPPKDYYNLSGGHGPETPPDTPPPRPPPRGSQSEYANMPNADTHAGENELPEMDLAVYTAITDGVSDSDYVLY